MKDNNKHTNPDYMLNMALFLLQKLKEQNVSVAMFGGIAIWNLCKDQREWLLKMNRKYKDIDFVCFSYDFHKVKEIICSEGYDLLFNSTFNIYNKAEFSNNSLLIDVYFDKLEFNYKINFSKEDIKGNSGTITPSILLLTKLQIVNLKHNLNDELDTLALLREFDYSSMELFSKLSKELKKNYFLYKTVITNLLYLSTKVYGYSKLNNKIKTLIHDLKNVRKTCTWYFYQILYRENIKYNKIR